MLHMIEEHSLNLKKNIKNIAFYWMQTTPAKNYYCETCDKSFREEDELLYHESEHETCGEEGCEFTAHPKIIAKHIKMQHETGLYSRIGKLYSQEEINKWIEERKRRYPSRKVIEEKKALEQKKFERGERIKRDENRFNKSFGKKTKNENKRNKDKPVERKLNDKKIERVKKPPIVILQPTNENTDWVGGIPPFPGIRKSKPEPEPKVEIEEEIKEPDTLDISDEEWEPANTTTEISAPVVNSSLSLLASCYGSDDSEEEEEEKKEAVDVDDNDSAPEEVKTVSVKAENAEENKEVDYEKKIPGKRKRRHNRGSKNKLEKKSNKKIRGDNQSENRFHNVRERSLTLLEKLLSNEIRHERNVILQCVRYVVQNKFFQK